MTQASRARRREALTAYAFLAPTMAGFVLFVLGPMVASFALGLFSWDLFTAPIFTGLKNFGTLLTDTLLHQTLLNTLVFAIGAESLNIGLGLLIAVGINRIRHRRMASFLRFSYFLPFVMSYAVVSVLWGILLQPDFGVVNYFLGLVGIGPVSWLTSSATAMPTVILIDVWKNVGFFIIVFLAGLQAIPIELYDAVRVDGGGGWATFRHVTLPLLSPSIFFATVIALIGASQVFESIYVLTGGGPGDSTRTVMMYLYNEAFGSLRMGYGGAISLLIFLIVFVLTIGQLWLSRRWVFYR